MVILVPVEGSDDGAGMMQAPMVDEPVFAHNRFDSVSEASEPQEESERLSSRQGNAPQYGMRAEEERSRTPFRQHNHTDGERSRPPSRFANRAGEERSGKPSRYVSRAEEERSQPPSQALPPPAASSHATSPHATPAHANPLLAHPPLSNGNHPTHLTPHPNASHTTLSSRKSSPRKPASFEAEDYKLAKDKESPLHGLGMFKKKFRNVVNGRRMDQSEGDLYSTYLNEAGGRRANRDASIEDFQRL